MDHVCDLVLVESPSQLVDPGHVPADERDSLELLR